MSEGLKPFLLPLSRGETLSAEDAARAFTLIMTGGASHPQIAAFLMALRVRGETADEILGGARVMRAQAVPVKVPADALDTCGTGGGGQNTLNISTAVALVIASLGVPVAKHGNRAASSRSGTADVLQRLGVNIELKPVAIERCLAEARVCFMFAPLHHTAMKHVAPVRAELGVPTIFNLLGPLSNPGGTKRQLLGVFAKKWTSVFASVLKQLGSERAWVVHGSDGLDEVTITGTSHVAALENGAIREFTIAPEDAGLPRATLSDIRGGDPENNAAALTAILGGEANPYRDIVALNAAAALVVAGKADDLKDGAAQALAALGDGRARDTLAKLVKASNA